jgi:ribose-phosphate pyrophosphokinase
MKSVLDLTSQRSEYNGVNNLKYKISKFPDGQQTVDVVPVFFKHNDTVEIQSRLNNFRDLELIICATQALKNLGVKNITLYVPYFIGGRSDRQFQDGGVNYLKQVIAPIINSQGYSKVTILDPHSDVLEAVINNFSKQNNFRLIKFALERIDNKNDARDRVCLVSPDAGAYKKIFDVAKYFNIDNIITATKVRDLKTGNIVKTEVPIGVYDAGKSFVIIDDICDGGRTFIEIAKAIRSTTSLSSVTNQHTKIYLVVTHGIFSAGFDNLNEYFDGIFTTNSVKDIEEMDSTYKVNQLNVF